MGGDVIGRRTAAVTLLVTAAAVGVWAQGFSAEPVFDVGLFADG